MKQNLTYVVIFDPMRSNLTPHEVISIYNKLTDMIKPLNFLKTIVYLQQYHETTFR